ncbi:MAG: hypothetical protein V4618_00870 [Pseudomonadota bacterium]
MADIEWPGGVVPFRVSYYLQPHVGGTESPFNRQRKTYELSAPRWLCRLSFRGGYDGPSGAAAMGAYLDALIVQLRGGVNRVPIHDFRRPTWRRSRWGRPVVTNAGLANEAAVKGATSIVVTGYAAHSYAYGVGDYIGGDGRSHLVRADAWADEFGKATVSFDPPLAADVAASAAIYSEVTSWFTLVGDDAGMNETEVGELTPYTLDFIEDLNGYD